jgi:hypothetical protein
VNRKYLLAAGLAGAMAIGTGSSVVIADFCADDPVITVAPNKVVYLTDYADSQYLDSLKAVRYRVLYTYGDQSGRLHVTLLIYIPSGPTGDQFDIDYVISTGPDGSGTVLAKGHGQSGQVLILRFVVS